MSGDQAAADEPSDFPAAVYAALLVVYVVLGYVLKTVVLNWIVGPLFLAVVLSVVPRAARAVRGR